MLPSPLRRAGFHRGIPGDGGGGRGLGGGGGEGFGGRGGKGLGRGAGGEGLGGAGTLSGLLRNLAGGGARSGAAAAAARHTSRSRRMSGIVASPLRLAPGSAERPLAAKATNARACAGRPSFAGFQTLAASGIELNGCVRTVAQLNDLVGQAAARGRLANRTWGAVPWLSELICGQTFICSLSQSGAAGGPMAGPPTTGCLREVDSPSDTSANRNCQFSGVDS